tara:strand:+ start:232 stop:489 length:258 start_codon:yes stop_codon:yes gene_type:complete
MRDTKYKKIRRFALKPKDVTPDFLSDKGDVLIFCLKYFDWYWASDKDVRLRNLECTRNLDSNKFNKNVEESKKFADLHIKLCENI